MRVKQLLGMILLATVITAPAAGSVSQLAGVQVEKRDQASVITILANGPFTHTEYRPTDNLMLVDLAGVSAEHQDAAIHAVSSVGVKSYRVVGYRSASGAEVARIELGLVPGASTRVNDIKGGLEVRITGDTSPVAASAEPAAAKTSVAAAGHLNHISSITVARANDGMSIEVSGTSAITAKTMKLANPSRIVLDIPNSVLEGHTRQIAVNSGDVKSIRAARFQSDPPTTRIVVDVAAMHDFDLVPAGNKLLLKLKNTDVAVQPVSVPHPAVAQQAPKSEKQPESKPAVTESATAKQPESKPAAMESTILQPIVLGTAPAEASAAKAPAPSQTATADAKTSKPSAQERSDRAAAYFASPEPPLLVGTSKASAHLAAEPKVVNAALQQQQQQPQQQPVTSNTAPTSCTSGRYAGSPFNLDLKDLDIKDFFRLIHEISGLNVVLDPSVKGIVTIDVTDIPWDQALAIVLRNNGLECELEGNVLRIASLETLRAEADARRLQQEAQALAVPRQNYTRYLSYAHSKDVVPIIKKFLSSRGDAVADDRSNAVIIEDIPSTLPKVDELLTKLDRKTPEVDIEARVVAATRNFARDIGTQIGFGWGNGSTSAAGGGTGIASPIQVTPAPGTTPGFLTIPGNTSQIPLFSNLPATGPTSGFSFTNFTNLYRLDFVLTMAETRGLVKILSRPRITTQNNIQSMIEQGSRIPVVTQAQLGGPPTVTYVDAFLKLTVTPQITSDNTIFLLLDVENTTPDFTRVTGAQLNPTLNTQRATTQVLVGDGQTVVLGGVIQTQNSLAIGQIPLLGSIPLLGNLFKHTAINTSTAELIFFITPKIIQTS